MPEEAGPVSWVATVRPVEDGFFIAHADRPAQMPERFSIRSVDGMPATTQFFRLHVDLDAPSAGAEVWIVCTALPTGNRKPRPGTPGAFDEASLIEVRSALATALPDATLCFTTEDREGFAHLVGDPERAPAIAAAVAVVKYYAAWDESDPIDVTVADDAFAVSVGFVEKEYRATVRRKSSIASAR